MDTVLKEFIMLNHEIRSIRLSNAGILEAFQNMVIPNNLNPQQTISWMHVEKAANAFGTTMDLTPIVIEQNDEFSQHCQVLYNRLDLLSISYRRIRPLGAKVRELIRKHDYEIIPIEMYNSFENHYVQINDLVQEVLGAIDELSADIPLQPEI